MLEYPLVGFGLGSVVARAKGWTDSRVRVGVVALFSYMSVQLAAHVLLNLRIVNVHLVSSASPSVSLAAVDRLRESGDVSSLPLLQQKFLDDLEKQGSLTSDKLLETLTQLGGAKGWQDLLESGRLGVSGRDARTWRFVINNVREMANPLYAAARGGVISPYLRDEDIARLTDALALKLAEDLEAAPDSEAALTLLTLMKERPDLCAKYLERVPNGLRDRMSQATYEIVAHLAAMKSGRPPGSTVNLSKEEIFRIGREQALIADEWTAWARSDASACRSR